MLRIYFMKKNILSLIIFNIVFANYVYWEPAIPSPGGMIEIFYDSEEAAEKVNLIWSDVEGWWQGKEVQCAIDEFVYSFARVDDDWKKSWKNALLKLI